MEFIWLKQMSKEHVADIPTLINHVSIIVVGKRKVYYRFN